MRGLLSIEIGARGWLNCRSYESDVRHVQWNGSDTAGVVVSGECGAGGSIAILCWSGLLIGV